jgi:hypothetical protein
LINVFIDGVIIQSRLLSPVIQMQNMSQRRRHSDREAQSMEGPDLPAEQRFAIKNTAISDI